MAVSPAKLGEAVEAAAAPMVPDIPDMPAVPAVTESAATTTYKLSAPSTSLNYEALTSKPAAPEASLEMPKFDMPKFDMPKFDKVEMPKFDKVEMPKFDAPKFDAPKIEAPKIDLPKIDLPDMSGATESFSKASEGLTSAVSGLTGSVGSSLTGLTDTVTEGTAALTRDLGKQLGVSSGAASEAAASVAATVDAASSAVNSTLNQVTGAGSEVFGQASAAAAQVWDQLPPEAREIVVVGAKGVQFVYQLAREHPTEAATVAGAVTLPLLVSWYATSFAGYSGDLDPRYVYQLLQEESGVVLVDVREESDLMEAGLPELKLSARYKAASMPFSSANAFVVSKQTANREQLRIELVAAFIAGLKQVTPLSKVVVMDKQGSGLAKDLAKALRKEGVYQAFVLKGGFARWTAEGLPTITGSDYQANPALVLKDEVELLTSKAGALIARAKDPMVGLPLAAGTAAGVAAVANYHTSLQAIGLWGLTYSLYNGISTGKIQRAIDGASAVASRAASSRKPAPRPVGTPRGAIMTKSTGISAAPRPAAPPAPVSVSASASTEKQTAGSEL